MQGRQPRLRRAAVVGACVLGSLGGWPPAAGAQGPAPGQDPGQQPVHALQARGQVPVLAATRLTPSERVALDGRLDEVLWRRAQAADGFLQQEPVEGRPPTERTEVRVVYDADNLYIGALLHDSEPDGILGYQRQRDQDLDSDDRFMVVLDTFLDGRTAYYFETNPAGLMGDGLVRNTGYARVNKAWDGVWEARAARGARGWSAEIRIPFRTLNFDESSDVWGINFQRTVRRKNEELVWSGHRRNQGLLRPIHAGRLTGLRDLTQGLGLEVVPYGAATWRSGAGIPTAIPLDAGVDMNYSVTSNLRAAVTVNTDFAEAEVDRRRVNLTRFPLFYPEQRDFFLENASIFEFAPLNAVNPYFSRRIGLDEGQVIPIEYGTRLAGQAGANDLGFLQIRTGPVNGRPAEDFTVARVKRNFLAQSSIGVLYTRRAASAGEHGPAAADRHTVGADLDLFTSEFVGDKNFQFQAFYVVHTDPERGGIAGGAADRASRGFRINYPNDVWEAHLSFREFGERWDPAVGFVQRRGFRRSNPVVTFAPRPDWFDSVRHLEFRFYYEHLTDLDNRLLTRQTGLTLLGVVWESGDRFDLRRNFNFELLEAPFEIHPGVLLPIGAYAFDDWQLNAETASHRRLSGSVSVAVGELWSGDRAALQLGLTVRPYAGVTATAEWEHENVDLREGRFRTNLVRMLGSWHASPWIAFDGNLQYDTVTAVAGLYTRLRWILRPGSDFYFVYTENWRSMRDRFHTLSRGATTKINYTHRF